MIETEQVKLFQDTYTKWSADYETVVSKTLLKQIKMREQNTLTMGESVDIIKTDELRYIKNAKSE